MNAKAIISALTLIFGFCVIVECCTCAKSLGPNDELLKSDAVYHGIVESKRHALPYTTRLWIDLQKEFPRMFSSLPSNDLEYALIFRFRVQSSWKGIEADYVEIVTDEWRGGSCGCPFEIGKEYLVYAHQYMDMYATSSCSRTVPIEWAAGDLSLLGAPKDAFTITLPSAKLPISQSLLPTFVLVTIALLIKRHRNRK